MTLINEKLSISPKSEAFCQYILQSISDDIHNHTEKESNGRKYKEGSLTLSTDGFIEEPEQLQIDYIVYKIRDMIDFNYMIRSGQYNLNSSADYDNGTINIVLCSTSLYDLQFADSTYWGTVLHEVNHILQYASGFVKNKRIEKVIEELLSNNKEIYQTIGQLLYFLQTHEQDAFANSFYGTLCQNNIARTTSVDYVLQYSEFPRFLRLIEKFYSYPRQEVEEVLKTYNIKPNNVRKLITKSKARFLKKLENVYKRYCEEISGVTVSETLMRLLNR